MLRGIIILILVFIIIQMDEAVAYNEYEGEMFGKKIKLTIYDVPKELADIVWKDSYKEGVRLQKIFNFYDKESELSKLNSTRKMKVSYELLEVLRTALYYCDKTGGLYDISIGKQILARKSGKEETALKCSYKNISISDDGLVELTHEDVLIDLGSVAKGYMADRVGAFLRKEGVESFLIDARGDLLVRGNYEQEVRIQHPREKEKTIHPIKVQNAGVATSGDYSQYYGSYKKSHIIGQKELISVTVVAPTLMEADVFASAVYLLSKKEREELIKENPQIKVLTIDEELNETAYNGI